MKELYDKICKFNEKFEDDGWKILWIVKEKEDENLQNS